MPKTTTRNTGKLVIPLVVLVVAVTAAFVFRPEKTNEAIRFIYVTNSLPDITLDRILPDNETVNLLENDLRPGETVLLSIPEAGSELTASDADGGVYLFDAASADSADTLRVQISMSDRDTFEHIMESDGEFHTGSGESTVRITNGLEWHSIHTITVTFEGGDPASSPNILDAFVLPPGKTLNARVSRGSYTVNATDDMGNHYSCRVSLTLPDQAAATCSISENCLLYTMKSSGTGSGRLILCNALGDWIITGLYHRNSGTETWSENHLLTSGIEPKELFSLLLDPGTYDVKVVDEDNDSYTRYGIEVSDAGNNWNVSMSDLDRFIP